MHKPNICHRRRFPCNPPLLSKNTNFNFADFCRKKYVIKRRGCHFTCIVHWNGSATILPVLYVWDSCIKQRFEKENPTTFLKLQFVSQIKQITVSVTLEKRIRFSYDILQSFGVKSHFVSYFHEHPSRRKNFLFALVPSMPLPCHQFSILVFRLPTLYNLRKWERCWITHLTEHAPTRFIFEVIIYSYIWLKWFVAEISMWRPGFDSKPQKRGICGVYSGTGSAAVFLVNINSPRLHIDAFLLSNQ
jgi:hypothetical protein